MRILYHHRTMGDGAEGVHIREMVKALRQLKHLVRVVSIVGEPNEDRPNAAASSWHFVRKQIPSWCYELAEIGYNYVDLYRLHRAIEAFRPHFVYDRYNSYSTAALRASRRYGCPLVLEVNAPVVFERTNYEYMRLKFPKLAERYERRIFEGADHIVTVSSALKNYLITERHIPSEKISVMPNAINPDFAKGENGAAIRERYGFKQRTVVGFVGSLRAWHGLDLLMSVMPKVIVRDPSCHFLIVGAGELEKKFQEYVQQHGLSRNVTMTGWVPHQEVSSYIAAMDVTLMPDSNFYGSPIKIFEYMALGKAVVAPQLSPLEEVIAHCVNGILFKPGSSEALLEAIQGLVGDRAKRIAIGENAKNAVFERHTWSRNAERLTAIAQRLEANNRPKAFKEPREDL